MAKRTVLERIDDMLEMIEAIRMIEAERPDARPLMSKLATERAFAILSEASRHIPQELKKTEPAVAWRDIAGLGNVIRHEYQSVSEPVLRGASADHLDDLKQALLRMKAIAPSG